MAIAKLDDDIIAEFSDGFSGELIRPSDPSYDDVRKIWNAMIDRRPALIACCRNAGDVASAIGFARKHHLAIAVRGGGHNIAGKAICDDGLLIDLSLMKGVTVNVDGRSATVEAGCTLADFDAAAQNHGLATPLGVNSTTGVAGLTLGGGFGWLSRKHGLTIDNLISAELVTADRKQVYASATQNEDLFWGLRGGGGNFGVVTKFEFRLHPLGPEVLSGLIVFPFDQAKAVFTQYARFTEQMPDDLNVWVMTRKAPPLPFLPESAHGKEVVVLVLCYAGDPKEGEKLIEPIRSFGPAIGEHIGVQPYVEWQQAFDPMLTPGARNYWKSHNFTQLSEGLFDEIIEYAGKLPSPHCEIFIAALGGQTTRVAPDAMAYSNRDANYVMNVHGRWDSASEDETGIAWSREVFEKSKPFASQGAYMNFLTDEETDRISSSYGPNYDRLVKLKEKYDPNNVFSVNHNIRPG